MTKCPNAQKDRRREGRWNMKTQEGIHIIILEGYYKVSHHTA
jgi:hypothetical protein